MKNKLQENTSLKTRKVARIQLALNREVIRELPARELTEVLGGADTGFVEFPCTSTRVMPAHG